MWCLYNFHYVDINITSDQYDMDLTLWILIYHDGVNINTSGYKFTARWCLY